MLIETSALRAGLRPKTRELEQSISLGFGRNARTTVPIVSDEVNYTLADPECRIDVDPRRWKVYIRLMSDARLPPLVPGDWSGANGLVATFFAGARPAYPFRTDGIAVPVILEYPDWHIFSVVPPKWSEMDMALSLIGTAAYNPRHDAIWLNSATPV